MLLEKNSKFSIEYTNFNQRIRKIENEKIKTEATNLLNQLVSYVRRIDNQHKDLAFQQTLSEDISTIRLDIARTRKRLTQILNSYENTVKNQPSIDSN